MQNYLDIGFLSVLSYIGLFLWHLFQVYRTKVEDRLPTNVQHDIENMIRIVVVGVEQWNKLHAMTPDQRKQLAVAEVDKALKAIHLDTFFGASTIDVMIEAAVSRLDPTPKSSPASNQAPYDPFLVAATPSVAASPLATQDSATVVVRQPAAPAIENAATATPLATATA